MTRHAKSAAILLAPLLWSSTAFPADAPTFEIAPLTDTLYKLTTDGGGYTVKVIASIGEDGLLLVDTGKKATGEQLKAALASLGDSIPEIIINTHAHEEHTGGNRAFGREPLIIGHTNLRATLRSGSYLFDEFPDESLPELTFTDSLSLYFNGEVIKLIAFPGAHDNSDIIVWFTESQVVCVGGLSNGPHFPSVDEVTGDVLMYPAVVHELIDLLPEDVTVIPAHGADGTVDDLRALHEMLVQTTRLVREGLAEGKDVASLQQEHVLMDWMSFEGSYVDANQWIQYLADGFQRIDRKQALYEPMYYALRDRGPSGAVEEYYELQANHADEYRFREDELVYIAYKLFQNERIPEATRFFELCAAEYPEGAYTWLCYDYMGRGYTERGDHDLAATIYRKSLELNPQNTHAAEALEQLSNQ
jgi:glyoxylase-like metal-dependent hydrolase (beta-lactamase superfamily II)